MLIAHVLSHSALKRLDPFTSFSHWRLLLGPPKAISSPGWTSPGPSVSPTRQDPEFQFVNVVLESGSQKWVQCLSALRHVEKRRTNPPLNVLATDTAKAAAGCPPSLCQPRCQVPSCRAGPSQAGITVSLHQVVFPVQGQNLVLVLDEFSWFLLSHSSNLSRSLWITPLNSTPWIVPKFGVISQLEESAVRPLTKPWTRTGCRKRPRALHLLPASRQNMTH